MVVHLPVALLWSTDLEQLGNGLFTIWEAVLIAACNSAGPTRIIQLKDGELSLFSNIWAIVHFSEKSSTHLVILLFHETYSKPF